MDCDNDGRSEMLRASLDSIILLFLAISMQVDGKRTWRKNWNIQTIYELDYFSASSWSFPGRWEVNVTESSKYSKNFAIQLFDCFEFNVWRWIWGENVTKTEIFKLFLRSIMTLFLVLNIQVCEKWKWDNSWSIQNILWFNNSSAFSWRFASRREAWITEKLKYSNYFSIELLYCF